jgi:hemerythrin-like domain-containing protein
MDPIETLKNEHRLIRWFVDLISRAAEEIDQGRLPPREFFEMGVEFARQFADTFHHRKEEHVMFVRLAQLRDGSIDGQIEALRYQHEQGRDFIRDIAEALDGYAVGDPVSIDNVRENAAAYASLLRHHMHTEDHVFFPMADATLTDQDVEELRSDFVGEQNRLGADTFARNHKLVVDMSDILGADDRSEPVTVGE